MKTLTRLTLILSVILPFAVCAQEAKIIPAKKILRPKATRKAEKSTYLGVHTTAATETLRKQIGLKEGVGLAVTHVTAGSPAATAGLQKHDVIKLVDDQIIINSAQFGQLIRNYGVGDTVKLTIIRETKPQVIEATLGETTRNAFGVLPFQNNPMVLRLDGLDDVGGVPLQIMPGIGRQGDQEQIKEAMSKLREKMKAGDVPEGLGIVIENLEEALKKGNPNATINMKVLKGGDGFVGVKSFNTITDGKHNITTWTDENGKQVKVTDKQGNVVFTGPINDEEQLKAVPKEFREKLNNMTMRFKIMDMKKRRKRGKEEEGGQTL